MTIIDNFTDLPPEIADAITTKAPHINIQAGKPFTVAFGEITHDIAINPLKPEDIDYWQKQAEKRTDIYFVKNTIPSKES